MSLDVHVNQFADADGVTNCETCHQALAWTPSRFDHEEDSGFSLEGAHQTVPCDLCHVEEQSANGERVRIFGGTPTECAACH